MKDLDELKARLEKLGINGKWVETEGLCFEPESFKKQRELLGQVKGLLEKQLEDDVQLVSMLREELNRVRHGGGS